MILPLSEKTIEQLTIENWIKCFIDEVINVENSIIELESIIKKCSTAHFDLLNIDLDKYVGKIDEFLEFIEIEWQQKVEYDKKNGIIIVDENKDYCVCPLVNSNIISSEKVCTCSEGFAESMYSYILQKHVKVKVIRSWLRDKKSCIYKIFIK